MALTPITDAAIDSAKIGSIVGDTLTGTAQQNKERFDELPLLVANKLNDVIKQLNGTTSGASIDITGDITADGDLAVDGDATIGGTLLVSGTTDITGTLNVHDIDVNSISINGDASTAYTAEEKTKLQAIGTTGTNDDAVSIESNSNAVDTGEGFTLGAGSYLLVGCVQFASNSTGRRMVQWYDNTNSAIIQSSVNSATPVDGAITRLQSIAIVTPNESTTYRIRAQQNTGSALSANIYLKYIKIG